MKDARERMYNLGNQMVPTITLWTSDDLEAQHELDEYTIKPLALRDEFDNFVRLKLPISQHQLEKKLPKNPENNVRLSDHFEKIFEIVHGST